MVEIEPLDQGTKLALLHRAGVAIGGALPDDVSFVLVLSEAVFAYRPRNSRPTSDYEYKPGPALSSFHSCLPPFSLTQMISGRAIRGIVA